MNAVLRKISKSITVCYSEVFPNQDNEYFHFAYLGKIFLVADSYCMNPECTCQEAALHFFQVYPREGKKADEFMVRYKLNGRGYKIHERGRFTKREIQSILMHFTVDPALLEQLNERYQEMKEKINEMIGYEKDISPSKNTL